MALIRRRTGLASLAALAGITVAVVAAHAVAPRWARQAGLDVWNIVEVEAEQRQVEAEARQMAAARARTFRQLEVADHIARFVAGGQLSLAEAVDDVAELNRDRPEFLDGLRLANPDIRSDRLLIARYLVDKIELQLETSDSRQVVLERLEADYARLDH